MGAITRRTAALWVPDWPAVAALIEEGLPWSKSLAVQHGREMTAVSAQARREGVRRGHTKRLAQRFSPGLHIVAADVQRDARHFNDVVVAAEGVLAAVQVARPGLLLGGVEQGNAFHGGEDRLLAAVLSAVTQETGIEASVGIADGLLATVIAARLGHIIDAGGSPDFLREQSVDTLELICFDEQERQEFRALIDILRRLGVRTLGDLLNLPFGHVISRFGAVGARAYRLAQAQEALAFSPHEAEVEIAAVYLCDEPVIDVGQLVHSAKELAEQLLEQLDQHDVSCTLVRIQVKTEGGDTAERVWRTSSQNFVKNLSERVRWQLEGWTTSAQALGPIVELSLFAAEVVPRSDEQGLLWGQSRQQSTVERSIERIQSLLGLEGVLSLSPQGGRSPQDGMHFQAWGGADLPSRPLARPWPGRIPAPHPATTFTTPVVVKLADITDETVRISRRLQMSAPPTWLHYERTKRAVSAWSGPWPVIERWWAKESQSRVYLQIGTEEGMAFLLSCAQGIWQVEGIYD